MTSIQYTIRNIPPRVDKVLRSRAKKQGVSFNAAVVEVLQDSVGYDTKNQKYTDLDWFFGGGMIDQTTFDEALREQRKIDLELWQ